MSWLIFLQLPFVCRFRPTTARNFGLHSNLCPSLLISLLRTVRRPVCGGLKVRRGVPNLEDALGVSGENLLPKQQHIPLDDKEAEDHQSNAVDEKLCHSEGGKKGDLSVGNVSTAVLTSSACDTKKPTAKKRVAISIFVFWELRLFV